MAIVEVLVIAGSVVSAVGICAMAWYLSIINAAHINQQGIDKRAAMKLASGEGITTSTPYGQNAEGWMPIALELSKNPEVVKLLINYAPGILEKLNIKQGVN